MGVYSEMDLEMRYGGSPVEGREDIPAFADEDAPPAFVEEVPEAPAVTPPAFAEDVNQPQEITPPIAPSAPTQEDGEAQEDTQSDADKAARAAADKADEDAKRKAHEEAETKRKAEFDARQAAKKAAEKEQLDRLSAMSDDEVMAASMKRVSTDTEKLTRRNMMECVAEYIQTMCIEDPAFARKTMHPRKNMIRCYQYINRKAWEYVQDEMKAKGIQPGRDNPSYASAIPEGVCYQWAVDYFNDPDAKEDHEEEEKFVPNPYRGGTTSKSKNGAKGKGKSADKKESAPKKTESAEPPKKPADNMGQLSLGDFAMPEEKAG